MGTRLSSSLLLLVLGMTAGCGGDHGASSGSTATLAAAADAGPVHVHGLGINPADRALLLATHTGLYRVGPGEKTAERVSDRHQDTMGFTVVQRDHFLGSGHPDLRDDLPPLLGLIESKDGGRSWRPISLQGKADFHVLRAVGERVYGFDVTSGRLLVSSDEGRNWRAQRTPGGLLDLAVDPANPGGLVAAGKNRLYTSVDAGRTWRPLTEGSGLLAWPNPSRLYLLAGDGGVWMSPNGGRRWKKAGSAGAAPAAFLAAGPRELYAALHDGTIKHSNDAGRSWSVRSHP